MSAGTRGVKPSCPDPKQEVGKVSGTVDDTAEQMQTLAQSFPDLTVFPETWHPSGASPSLQIQTINSVFLLNVVQANTERAESR